MSELKVYHCNEWHNEYTEFYLKFEADKVIAEKDTIIEEQIKEIKFMHQHCKHGEHCGTSCAQIHGELMQATIEIAELKEKRDTAEKLLNKALDCVSNGKNHMMSLARKKNHADYKRCLAMAKWCRTSAQYDMRFGAFKYSERYWKWYKRWLAIAEKFKEAK